MKTFSNYTSVKVTVASYTFNVVIIYQMPPSKENRVSQSDFIEKIFRSTLRYNTDRPATSHRLLYHPLG